MIEFEANLFEFKISLNTNLNTSYGVIEKMNLISNPNRSCVQLASLKKLKRVMSFRTVKPNILCKPKLNLTHSHESKLDIS